MNNLDDDSNINELNNIQLEILFNKLYNISKSNTFIDNKDYIKSLLKKKYKTTDFSSEFFIEEKYDDQLLQRKNINGNNYISDEEFKIMDNITNTIIHDTKILQQKKYSINEELNNIKNKINNLQYNNNNTSVIQSSSNEIKNNLDTLETNIVSDINKINKLQNIINYCDDIVKQKNNKNNDNNNDNNNNDDNNTLLNDNIKTHKHNQQLIPKIKKQSKTT